MTERSYWLGFSSFSGIGPGKFSLLLKEFGSAKFAWGASFSELEKVLGKTWTPRFVDFRDKFSISEYEKRLKKARVSYLILTDKDYPSLLAQINKPPFVLYYKGSLEILQFRHSGEDEERLQNLPKEKEEISDSGHGQNDGIIAIVGTRRITEYGKQVTQVLTSDLVNNGFVIVSGLALGVDATAHKTTIMNKGKTIAVLGCGVDCCYPRENQQVYENILDNGGAIVSEYPLGQQPSQGSFPSRNRIISGLSQGVIVTEGASDSGALYTAKDAIDAGRPVYAVPGPITSSLSKGPHGLIAKGAKLISSAEEIIIDLGFIHSAGSGQANKGLRNEKSNLKGDTKEEQVIIDLLQNEDVHFDEMVKRSNIKSASLGSLLSMMEVKGFVKSKSDGNYSLNN